MLPVLRSVGKNKSSNHWHYAALLSVVLQLGTPY